MKTIAVIFGTRPDTIKLAPMIKEIQKNKKYFRLISIATAQHRQMLDQVLEVFGIEPDYDLNIMKPRQSLADITRKSLDALDKILFERRPDMVLVQGDTTTTFVGGLSAFYRQIPVGHVEAGLRTNDRANPFPEEINRRLTSCVSNLHFAPTATAKRALLKENVDKNSVFVTGNTVIDALNIAVKQNYQFTRGQVSELISHKRKMVLITLHRRENWGEPLGNAARAIRDLAFNHPDIDFIFPIHLNPIVREAISPHMKGIKNIYLIEPLDYPDFVNLMSRCHLIITDSGGVQEEGPHFGIPILVLRKVTERPEAVKYGTVKLVGLETDTIYRTAEKLLRNKTAYEKMASATNPYGDGLASVRIINIIKKYFNLPYDPIEEFNAGI